MNYVITMAGEGSRFVDAGYDVPKMLLEYKGEPLFNWSLKSLPISSEDRLILLVRREHAVEYNFEEMAKSVLPPGTDVVIVEVPGLTRGQASTAYLIKPIVDNDDPITIFNIDTYFVSNSLHNALGDEGVDAIIGAFIDETDSTRYSFARIDDGVVVEVREKERISSYALTGLYHFAKAAYFYEAYENSLSNEETALGEFYVAPLYNHLLGRGLSIKLDIVDEIKVFGTPEEYEFHLAS